MKMLNLAMKNSLYYPLMNIFKRSLKVYLWSYGLVSTLSNVAYVLRSINSINSSIERRTYAISDVLVITFRFDLFCLFELIVLSSLSIKEKTYLFESITISRYEHFMVVKNDMNMRNNKR